MTSRQIAHEIDQALAECGFEDWDVCDQLSSLTDDLDDSTIDNESVETEVEALIDEADDIGDFLANKIKEKLVGAIQSQ